MPAQFPDADKFYYLIDEKKRNKKLTHQQMVNIMNIQEECCRAILNRPNFEEIELAIHGKDSVYQYKRKHLAELKKKINTLSGSDKHECQLELNKIELFTGYVLPDDTMLFLTKIALGMDISDIKRITKEKLLSAYSKARLYNGRPSDYLPGLFTDGDRINIDDYASMLGCEEEAKNSKDRRI